MVITGEMLGEMKNELDGGVSSGITRSRGRETDLSSLQGMCERGAKKAYPANQCRHLSSMVVLPYGQFEFKLICMASPL